MDITNSFLNSIKNQGMGLPGATSSMQDTIESMLTDINSRNKELKNNNGNYFSDLLKQTGAALLKNPNDGVLTAMGQGMQGVDQVQKERKNEQLQNQQQALELRTLLFNTHRAVAEFGEKQRHSRVKEDLSRMDIEMKIGKNQMDEEQKRQAALNKGLQYGEKIFGSKGSRGTEEAKLNEMKDLYATHKNQVGFEGKGIPPFFGLRQNPLLDVINRELPEKQRIPKDLYADEGLFLTQRKIENLLKKGDAQIFYNDLISQGMNPNNAMDHTLKEYKLINDEGAVYDDSAN